MFDETRTQATRPIQTILTSNNKDSSVNYTVANVKLDSFMQYEGFRKIVDIISSRIAEDMYEDARKEILGSSKSKNAIFNQVVAKLVNKLADQ